MSYFVPTPRATRAPDHPDSHIRMGQKLADARAAFHASAIQDSGTLRLIEANAMARDLHDIDLIDATMRRAHIRPETKPRRKAKPGLIRNAITALALIGVGMVLAHVVNAAPLDRLTADLAAAGHAGKGVGDE